jgi:crossover junction endodeoxyribonuclease RusA
MTVVAFHALGLPAPQGSKRGFVAGGRAIVSDVNSVKLRTWRDSVSAAARDEFGDRPMLDEPVRVTVDFYFPMPKARGKKHSLLPKKTAPDLDKLCRAVGDALEIAGVIRSDALICSWHAGKWERDGWTGATICISNEAP